MAARPILVPDPTRLAPQVVDRLAGLGGMIMPWAEMDTRTQHNVITAVARAMTECRPDPTEDTTTTGAEHPDTSRQAALLALPRTGTQRHRVLTAIRASGDRGLTDSELGDRLGMNPSSVRPRRGELVQGMHIKDSGRRRATPSGAEAIVWVANTPGTLF